jgi:L-seryl-tRNA(Ser) seleniumtransferase
MKKNDILRRIPKIDEVLKEHLISDCFEKSGREVVTDAARGTIDSLRSEILALKDDELEKFDMSRLGAAEVAKAALSRLKSSEKNKLYGVINATGTILHTNLGRAPLCEDAVRNVAAVSSGYSDLEYDVKAGRRGSRHDILQDLMVELTGAEDVMIVNNNASATMLVLSAMAEGREVIVSRGELVEIGGSFRIPEIMEQSGAVLHEVGTTNKTKPSDYENAIDEEQTAALMKVHTSNYKIMGFTEEATLDDLVAIGKNRGLPVIFDMGNGLMLDLSEYGIDEPNVPAALATGIDVIMFSGDKLLGGPQAGIIAGRKKYIEKMKKHPLARALRVDKMTFAAMEETLKKYRDPEIAKRDIPVIRMITTPADVMRGRAERIAEAVKEKNSSLNVRVTEVKDQIGGGSAPMVFLPGFAAAVSMDGVSTKSLERLLRKNDVPVIARIHEDELLLCARTIRDCEIDTVAEALEAAGR